MRRRVEIPKGDGINRDIARLAGCIIHGQIARTRGARDQ